MQEIKQVHLNLTCFCQIDIDLRIIGAKDLFAVSIDRLVNYLENQTWKTVCFSFEVELPEMVSNNLNERSVSMLI